MNYEIIRTDSAEANIREIIFYIANNFGIDVAFKKLDEIEKGILQLSINPHLGAEPRYLIMKRQGYRVLVLKKNLVIYKLDEAKKIVTIHAVVDQRKDYVNIIRGL